MSHSYESISEIQRDDTRELVPPQKEWDIEVLERGLSVNLGDVGGRDEYVANARVRVTETDGTTWEGLTRVT